MVTSEVDSDLMLARLGMRSLPSVVTVTPVHVNGTELAPIMTQTTHMVGAKTLTATLSQSQPIAKFKVVTGSLQMITG